MSSCKCEEKKKPLEKRDWNIDAYFPYKVWGPTAYNYDGRLLMHLYCKKCECLWSNNKPTSGYWKYLNQFGYSPQSPDPFVWSIKNKKEVKRFDK